MNRSIDVSGFSKSFNVSYFLSSPNSSPLKTFHESRPIFCPRSLYSSISPPPSILFFYGTNIRPITHPHKFLGGRWRIIRWNGGPTQCPRKWVKTGVGRSHNGVRYFYFRRGERDFFFAILMLFFIFFPPTEHSFN